MTDLTNKIKGAVIGLGLLTLVLVPLEGRDKVKSRKSHYKKDKNELRCTYKPAKKIHKLTRPYNQAAEVSYCVRKEAKKYHRFYKKEIKKK